MTIYVPAPAEMSDQAREALTDVLSSSVEPETLLDPTHHTTEDSLTTANELTRLGYLVPSETAGFVKFALELAVRPEPADHEPLDLQPAMDALKSIMRTARPGALPADLMAGVGVDSTPTGYRLVSTLHSLLLLATYTASGRIAPNAVAAHLTPIATILARTITSGGAPDDAP